MWFVALYQYINCKTPLSLAVVCVVKLWVNGISILNSDDISSYHATFIYSLNTVQWYHNVVNFLENTHDRHLIAHLCLLWMQTLIWVMPESLQFCMEYHVIFDPIMVCDCTLKLEQKGHHTAQKIVICIFLIAMNFIWIKSWVTLVQVMAWLSGDKPLPEPMLPQFTVPYSDHWPHWVEIYWFVWHNMVIDWGWVMHIYIHW